MMTLMAFLLVLFVLAAIWAVMAPRLLIAAIGLAATSVVLSIVIFMLGAPWAAVMELSVCAGLITVVFVSAISLTSPMSKAEEREFAKKKFWRFAPMPVIVAALGALLWLWLGHGPEPASLAAALPVDGEVREVLWNQRPLDLVGQIAVILTGIFGVVVLFKHLMPHREDEAR